MIDKVSTLKFYGLFLVILLASIAIQVPLHNRLLIFNDEGLICGLSEEILQGKVPFRDIPSYVLPGIFYILALLYKVFGVSLIVSRYAMAAIFSATAVLVFLISRRLMTPWIAFFTALAFVMHRVWAFPIWNMIGYATFAMFLIGNVLFLLMLFNQKPRLKLIFLVGALVAVAASFKQDYGVFTGAGVFLYLLLWPWLRSKNPVLPPETISRAKMISAYVAGGFLIALPAAAYFWSQSALFDLIQNTVIIPLTMETKRETVRLIPLWPLLTQDRFVRQDLYSYAPSVAYTRVLFSHIQQKPLGFFFLYTPLWDFLLKLIHYSPYLATIGAGILLARRYLKKSMDVRFENLTALWIVSFFILLTQHKPFDFAHLMQMYMPIFLMIGCLTDALYSSIKKSKFASCSLCGILGAAFLLYMYQSIVAARFVVDTYSARLEGSRGGIYMRPVDRDACENAIRFIQENTAPEDPIFVFPYHSLFYFLAERKNPTRFFLLWPVKIFPDMDEEIIATLDENQVKYLVYSPNPDLSVGSLEQIAPKIAEYADRQYSVKEVFGDQKRSTCFIILERNNNS